MSKNKTALLLIAYGSRQEEANNDLRDVVAQMRKRGEFAFVEGAFLELAKPSIEESGAHCVEQGAKRVVMLPLAGRFPEVDFRLAQPLGPHPLLLEIVAERARQAT